VGAWEEVVEGAADAEAAAIEDVGVDHGGADVGMTEQLLDRADVVAPFEEVRREAVTQGMAAGGFGEACRLCGAADGALQNGFMLMVAAPFSGDRVEVVAGRREYPLPGPVARSAWVFLTECVRDLDRSGAGAEIIEVSPARAIEVGSEGPCDCVGQGHGAILPALALPDDELPASEIDVLDSQPHTLLKAQTSAIEQGRHQARRSAHVTEECTDFVRIEDDRESLRALRAHHSREPLDRLPEDGAVKKEERRCRLILSRRADVTLGRETRKKCGHMSRSELTGMPPAVMEDVAADPVNVSLFSPGAVVTDP
jgi:hypothetical protein